MSEENTEKTRRLFLTTTAALGSATFLAGCSSGSDGESSTDAESGKESNTETQGLTETSTEDDGEFGYGSTREFKIELGDGRDPVYDGFAKPVRFDASAGDEVTITQTSDLFDTFLVLEGPDGSVVAKNDDGKEIGLDSRIKTRLRKSGEYTIWAGSLMGNVAGPFTLSLERGS